MPALASLAKLIVKSDSVCPVSGSQGSRLRDGPAARSSAFVLGARLNNTRTPGPCPELLRLRGYLHIPHTNGVRRGARGAHCGPLIARRGSGASRPSLHVGGARPGREGVAPSMPAMPPCIDATRSDARFHSVRRAGGRMGSARPFSAPIPRQIDIQWRGETISKLLR